MSHNLMDIIFGKSETGGSALIETVTGYEIAYQKVNIRFQREYLKEKRLPGCRLSSVSKLIGKKRELLVEIERDLVRARRLCRFAKSRFSVKEQALRESLAQSFEEMRVTILAFDENLETARVRYIGDKNIDVFIDLERLCYAALQKSVAQMYEKIRRNNPSLGAKAEIYVNSILNKFVGTNSGSMLMWTGILGFGSLLFLDPSDPGNSLRLLMNFVAEAKSKLPPGLI